MSFKVEMNAATLELLAADRKEKTVETFSPNDFYGHASLLKQYCGLPEDYIIHGVLPHGPCISSKIWEVEKNHPFRARFLLSQTQREVYQKQSNKDLYVIGSPLLYAARLLSDEVEALRQEARGTLVFPAHSTHHITSQFDHEGFIRRLKRVAPADQPVTVCLYWRDIQLGRHHEYLEAGFQCTTAGHMFDKGFLERMLKIIVSHKTAVTNRIGSSSLFAAALGLPVGFTTLEVEHAADQKQFETEIAPHDLPLVKPFIEAGSPLGQNSLETQQRLAKEATGADQLLSPEALRDLLLSVESIQNGKVQYTFPSLDIHLEPQKLLSEIKERSIATPRNQRGTIGFQGIPLEFFDLETFHDEAQRIFVENTYQFKATTPQPVIVDCGTNLGLLPIYYAKEFPQARIVAFEADPIKAQIAENNFKSAKVRNAKLIHQAVWLDNGMVPFLCQTDIGEPTVIQVPAVRLGDFIGGQTIDLLRLNLAGSEFHVIKENLKELANVRHLITEVCQLPGQAPHLADLLCTLSELGFQCHLFEHLRNAVKRPDKIKNLTLFAWRKRADKKPQQAFYSDPIPTLDNAVALKRPSPEVAKHNRSKSLLPC